MRKLLTTVAAAAVALGFAGAAQAADKPAGKIQIKVLGTAVLPTGTLDKAIYVDPALTGSPLLAAPATSLNDNAVPTLAIEYFFTPNISVETICCFTGHHVTGAGSLAAGQHLIDHVLVLPATLTAKYHLTGLPMGIKPYVGVGPAWYFYIGERASDFLKANTPITSAHLSNKVGVAVQVGVDVPIAGTPFGLSLDAKKYWVNTTAHFLVGNTEVLTTAHKVDPWVASAGVTYRF